MFSILKQLERLSWLFKLARVIVLLAGLFFLALYIPSAPQTRDDIAAAIHGHDHDILGWEFRNFFDKWLSRGASIFTDDPTEEEVIAEVREYARLTGEIGRIDGAINRAVTLGEPVSGLEEEKTGMVRQRDSIEARVEELIEAQISRILAEEGLSWRVSFLNADGYLFPPVDFKYESSPPVLVISPRDRIELESTRLLTPGLGVVERQDIEAEVEVLDDDYSALVVNTGGVATFPAVVGASANLQYTLRTVAHEWVHHYLIFYPLGRNYWASGEMVTINETVADIAGDEIGNAVYERYYEVKQPPPPTPAAVKRVFTYAAQASASACGTKSDGRLPGRSAKCAASDRNVVRGRSHSASYAPISRNGDTAPDANPRLPGSSCIADPRLAQCPARSPLSVNPVRLFHRHHREAAPDS